MENEFAAYPGVVVQAGRVGGNPTLGESRVPAKLVAESLDNGETPEEVAYKYTLPLNLVLDFKAYRDAHKPELKL